MGEALQGTELEFSGLQMEFKADISKSEYCKVALNDENLKAFLYAGIIINSKRFPECNFFQSKIIIGIKCTLMIFPSGE